MRDYWVVEVKEPPDLPAGLPGFTRRYKFHGEHAVTDAWRCWARALHAGFEARAERVRAFAKETASGAAPGSVQ